MPEGTEMTAQRMGYKEGKAVLMELLDSFGSIDQDAVVRNFKWNPIYVKDCFGQLVTEGKAVEIGSGRIKKA